MPRLFEKGKPADFEASGRLILGRGESEWVLTYRSNDGKRRDVAGVALPHSVTSDDELSQYVADLWHEQATQNNPDVR